VYDAGKKNGSVGINAAVGHYGAFDFQRNEGKGYQSLGNAFYKDYTDASNYAVGVYMSGAGYSLPGTVVIASRFAKLMSSNAGDPRQKEMWTKGWNDAQNFYSKSNFHFHK